MYCFRVSNNILTSLCVFAECTPVRERESERKVRRRREKFYVISWSSSITYKCKTILYAHTHTLIFLPCKIIFHSIFFFSLVHSFSSEKFPMRERKKGKFFMLKNGENKKSHLLKATKVLDIQGCNNQLLILSKWKTVD